MLRVVVHHFGVDDAAEARADVCDYGDRFYKAVRRQSTIGYLSPVEFELKVEFGIPQAWNASNLQFVGQPIRKRPEQRPPARFAWVDQMVADIGNIHRLSSEGCDQPAICNLPSCKQG